MWVRYNTANKYWEKSDDNVTFAPLDENWWGGDSADHFRDFRTANANTRTKALRFNAHRGNLASPTVLSAGDIVGEVRFQGYDGAAFVPGAILSSGVFGVPASGNVSTNFSFVTRAGDGLVERLRIEGNLIFVGSHGVSSGAGANDMVFPNDRGTRGVNAAGTSSVALIRLNASDVVVVNANSKGLKVENPVTHAAAGAVAGYLEVDIGGTTRRIPYHAVA